MNDWFFQTSWYFIIAVISSIIYFCTAQSQKSLDFSFLSVLLFFFIYQWRNLENKIKSSVQSLLKQFYYFPSIFSSPVLLRYILFLFSSCWLITILTAFLPFSVSVHYIERITATFPTGTYLVNNLFCPGLLKLVASVELFPLFLQTQWALAAFPNLNYWSHTEVN